MSAIKILEQVSFMSEVYFCYPEHTFVLQSNNKGRGGKTCSSAFGTDFEQWLAKFRGLFRTNPNA